MEMFANRQDSKIKPDAISYNAIPVCLSCSGMFGKAAGLMSEMNANGFEYV